MTGLTEGSRVTDGRRGMGTVVAIVRGTPGREAVYRVGWDGETEMDSRPYAADELYPSCAAYDRETLRLSGR